MHRSLFRSAAAAAAVIVAASFCLGQGKGFDTSRMNKTADACTDFFEYANGSWLSSTQIPASESRWGTFNILGDSNNEKLHTILEAAAKAKAPAGSDSQLIGDLYSSCMDEAAIDKAGAKPLNAYFRRIKEIRSISELEEYVAEMHSLGFPAMFTFGGGPDLKNSSMVIINGGQGGLSLPNRDYYLNTDAKSTETREKFIGYMTNIFKLLGDKPETASANAKVVMDIQTRMASASLKQEEFRNPDNRYNKIPFTAAQEITPNFSWKEYMAQRGIPAAADINFAQPNFFRELNVMLTQVPIESWKTYLRWMTVNAAAPALAKPFADENFKFFNTYLAGQKERQPRWKTCVQATDLNLGEALGMEFVKTNFTPRAKARMDELITNLFASMKTRINGLEWMSDATKVQAQAKLSAFKRKIGYPDKLRGYKGLSITADSYAGNILRSRAFQVKRNVDDIGKPVDRMRWGFTPPTVNASYNPTNNEITFPAGILQPPFFNFEADDAINYGAIGGVIGHEITHGFDDSGSRFDAEGNLKMWWTPEDRKKFEERAACVINQFNGYEVQPGLFINGKLTLGENIGDFAGLTVSYDAFQRSLQGGTRPSDIDGFTPEQRFFLGWAQVWAGKYTPEAERLQVATNPHSLPRWRVNGPLSNMPEFRKAFGCKSGQEMVRENSCQIW